MTENRYISVPYGPTNIVVKNFTNKFLTNDKVCCITVNNWCTGKTAVSESNMRLVYEFAFQKGIRLNRIKEQSAMFVATYPESSLYMLKFNPKGLKKRLFQVDRNWMLMVAYFRGRLKEYEDSAVIRRLIRGNVLDRVFIQILGLYLREEQ